MVQSAKSAKDPAIPAILGPSIACINRIEMGDAQASVFSVFPLLLSQITLNSASCLWEIISLNWIRAAPLTVFLEIRIR